MSAAAIASIATALASEPASNARRSGHARRRGPSRWRGPRRRRRRRARRNRARGRGRRARRRARGGTRRPPRAPGPPSGPRPRSTLRRDQRARTRARPSPRPFAIETTTLPASCVGVGLRGRRPPRPSGRQHDQLGGRQPRRCRRRRASRPGHPTAPAAPRPPPRPRGRVARPDDHVVAPAREPPAMPWPAGPVPPNTPIRIPRASHTPAVVPPFRASVGFTHGIRGGGDGRSRRGRRGHVVRVTRSRHISDMSPSRS